MKLGKRDLWQLGVALAASEISCVSGLLFTSSGNAKMALVTSATDLAVFALIFLAVLIPSALLTMSVFRRCLSVDNMFARGAGATGLSIVLASVLIALTAEAFRVLGPVRADSEPSPGFFETLFAVFFTIGPGFLFGFPLGGYGFKWLFQRDPNLLARSRAAAK